MAMLLSQQETGAVAIWQFLMTPPQKIAPICNGSRYAAREPDMRSESVVSRRGTGFVMPSKHKDFALVGSKSELGNGRLSGAPKMN